MRDQLEIQRAHDLLEPIVRREVPAPGQLDPERLAPIVRTLCWVLEDDNAESFNCFLQTVEQAMARMGFRLGNPLPFPMQRRPGGETGEET